MNFFWAAVYPAYKVLGQNLATGGIVKRRAWGGHRERDRRPGRDRWRQAIYGVVAFIVRRRSREIGIRIALGAQRQAVYRLVIKQGMKPVVFGSVLGLVASLASSRLVASQLYEISPSDPLTVTSILVLLVSFALLACRRSRTSGDDVTQTDPEFPPTSGCPPASPHRRGWP